MHGKGGGRCNIYQNSFGHVGERNIYPTSQQDRNDTPSKNLKVGDVMEKMDDLPRSEWRLAQVMDTAKTDL